MLLLWNRLFNLIFNNGTVGVILAIITWDKFLISPQPYCIQCQQLDTERRLFTLYVRTLGITENIPMYMGTHTLNVPQTFATLIINLGTVDEHISVGTTTGMLWFCRQTKRLHFLQQRDVNPTNCTSTSRRAVTWLPATVGAFEYCSAHITCKHTFAIISFCCHKHSLLSVYT